MAGGGREKGWGGTERGKVGGQRGKLVPKQEKVKGRGEEMYQEMRRTKGEGGNRKEMGCVFVCVFLFPQILL